MKKRKLLTIAIMAILILSACTPKTEPESAPETGDPAGQTSGQTTKTPDVVLEDPDGDHIYEYELTRDLYAQADLTLVNVWATWCGPCIAELPHLGELSAEYADKGLQIVGIIIDGNEAGALDTARGLIEDSASFYVHLLPTESMLSGYFGSVQYLPTTFFFDSNGILIGDPEIGAHDADSWRSIIDERLAEVQK